MDSQIIGDYPFFALVDCNFIYRKVNGTVIVIR